MKKYVAIFLILSLLLNLTGCYSFQQISVDDKSEMTDIESKDVKITLVNGDIIHSEAYHHIFIMNPTEFVFGSGSKFFKDKKSNKTYKGKIFLSDIDSSSFDKSKRLYTVWLKSKDKVYFSEGNYFIANSQTEKGFWYWDKNQTNKIDLNDIAMIEADRFNIVTTSLLAIAGGLIILIIYLEERFDFDGSLVGGNGSW